MSSPEATLIGEPADTTGPRRTRTALAGQEGLEPPTTGFGDRDSGQLSYCPLPPGSRRDPVQERSRHRADHHQLMKSTLPGGLRRTIWQDRANLPARCPPPALLTGNRDAVTIRGVPPW